MKEELLHYVWQHRLFATEQLKTTNGETIEIIDCGKKNEDAGPDFFNAKIKIGKTLWVGNVEIHAASSEWMQHNHHKDKSYDSVILHVVEKANAIVYRQNGEEIPQMEITIKKEVKERHEQLLASETWIRCEPWWNRLPPEFIHIYLSRLLNGRFIRKTEAIMEHLAQNNNNWEETFYIFLARNFGMNTNSLPFEMLAKSLPLALLGKHKNSLLQIEAMLFGQAGLLNSTKNNDDDKYFQILQREYAFLSHKFSLSPIDSSLWKFAKIHPANFPHIRLAQFAALIHQSRKLFSKLLETNGPDKLRDLFQCKASPYWETHYSFGESSTKRTKTIGEKSIDTLLINTVVPFLFAYSVKKEIPEAQEKAYTLLEKIAPEQNSIIEKWETLGIKARSAYETQALLELKKQYCDEKRCLQCGIGHKLLSKDKDFR